MGKNILRGDAEVAELEGGLFTGQPLSCYRSSFCTEPAPGSLTLATPGGGYKSPGPVAERRPELVEGPVEGLAMTGRESISIRVNTGVRTGDMG
ncbi:MAG TPA: hypothetical protein PK859_12765, partial [Spirochaetota bacterium]|nr:hypothetical protein [Spirochaetota bacterium]